MSTLWSEVLRRSRHQRTKCQPYIFHPYCPGWWCTHITFDIAFLPPPQFSFSHLQRMPFPPPASLPELMTYISCRPPHEQGQQRRTTPKGSVCVLIGALSSWSFFILPWWLELSLCLPHRRNIWNTSCPRTISFHLRMRWFVSYRGGVCSRVLNGVVGSVVNGKEWKRGRDLMKN